jgi:hypothetical protein
MFIKTKNNHGGKRPNSGRKKILVKNSGKIETINLELLAKLTQKKQEIKKTWSEFLAYLLEKLD